MHEHQLFPDPFSERLNLLLHGGGGRIRPRVRARQDQDHVRVPEALPRPGGRGAGVALIDDGLVAVLLLVEPGVQPVLEPGVEDVGAEFFKDLDARIVIRRGIFEQYPDAGFPKKV